MQESHHKVTGKNFIVIASNIRYKVDWRQLHICFSEVELIYSKVVLLSSEEVEEKNMKDYYKNMKKKIWMEWSGEKIYVKKNHYFKKNAKKNLDQNQNTYKDIYSLLTSWKPQEKQLLA